MRVIVTPQTELGWEIVSEPIRTDSGIIIDGYKSLRRSDNDKFLNVVKNSYNPMTNQQFDKMVTSLAEVTGFTKEGYSVFNNGGMVLGFLKNTGETKSIGGFEMQDYMVVGNSFDFSSSIFVGTSTNFLRCKNQFSQLKKGKGLSIPHTKNKDIKVEQLIKYFEVYMDSRLKMFANFESFRDIKLTEDLREQFLSDVLQINGEGELSTRKENQRSELIECIKTEEKDLGKTLWAAFNGVTYWTTHVKETKKDKVFGNVLGGMAEINERAYKSALQLIEA